MSARSARAARSLASFACLGLCLGAPLARADEATKACATAFEQAQYHQRDQKLASARASAVTCAAATCPAFVRDACQKILSDVEAAQPTLVFAAQDALGNDLVDVRVEIDGQVLTEKLGPEAVPVDPGEHSLRFVSPAGALEQHVLARVGEKNRIVRVTLPARPAATGPGTPPSPPAPGPSRWSPWPTAIAGGVALAAIGASIGVGASAKSDADHLRATCAPACAHSDVSSVDTRVVVSDVLLGAGVAAAAVAVVFVFVGRGRAEAPVAALRATPEGVAFAF